jgi:hypothetical protein
LGTASKYLVFEKNIMSTCWHCSGTGHCDCIICGDEKQKGACIFLCFITVNGARTREDARRVIERALKWEAMYLTGSVTDGDIEHNVRMAQSLSWTISQPINCCATKKNPKGKAPLTNSRS